MENQSPQQPMNQRPEGEPLSQENNVQGSPPETINPLQGSNETSSSPDVHHTYAAEQAPQQPAGLQDTSDEPAIRQPGPSEHIPFTYPDTSTPYSSPQGAPSSSYQSGEPAAFTPGSASNWSYPPTPEQYHAWTPGQPTQPGEPGQFAQNAYGPAYMPNSQPGYAGIQPAGYTRPAPPPRRGVRTGSIVALIALLAVIFATGIFAGWQFGHGDSNAANGNSLQSNNNSSVTIPNLSSSNVDAVREAVVHNVQPAIVQINVTSSSGQALGSGDIIDRRGYIVTNNHVVSNTSSITVTLSNGTTLPANLVGTDSADDLAVIKVVPPSSGLTTIPLGDSSALKVGQTVLAIGSPLGNSETVTNGIISALQRNVSESNTGPTLPDAIQTDAPINPGNSGGALVDLQGHLIGIPTLTAVNTDTNTPANGLGFAIPANRVKFIAEQLVNDGQVTHTGRAIIGVTVTSVNQAVAQQANLSVKSGVLVVSVTSGGPAQKAGVQTNDVIQQVNDTTVQSTSDLSRVLLASKPGDNVALKIYRGSQQMTINVTLGELAAN
jgi:S1-C subfamily serine protease